MRHAFWFLIIAFSISALSGGFLSGRAAVPHFAIASPTPAPPVSAVLVPPSLAQTDEIADDDFAQDGAVALDSSGGDVRQDATLALVLVDSGHSAALESPFLNLGVPVTLVVDPAAGAAREMARLAFEHDDAVFVQAHAPLTPAQITAARGIDAHIRGVALRVTSSADVTPQALGALRHGGATILDEYGESGSAREALLGEGVRVVVRSITVDDHVQRSYVRYMLQEAVHLGRGRTAVVMARPFPGTLQAFEDLLAQASRDGVRFVGLP